MKLSVSSPPMGERKDYDQRRNMTGGCAPFSKMDFRRENDAEKRLMGPNNGELA
jgi:hypothetical protein